MQRCHFVRFLTLVFLIWGTAPLLADEIHHNKGKKASRFFMDVEISRITYSTVYFKYMDSGMRKAGAQEEKLSNIKEIVFTYKPSSYMRAEEDERRGMYKQAIKYYEKALKERKAAAWVPQYCYYNIAQCYLRMGKRAEAMKSFQALLKKESDSRFYGETYTAMARIHVSLGDTAAAMSALDTLIATAGRTELSDEWGYQAKLEKAGFLENQSKTGPALRLYQGVASDSGSSYPGISRMAKLGEARCLQKEGKAAQSRTILKQVLQSAGSEEMEILAGAYNGIGGYHVSKGEWKDALLAYLRVVTLYEGVQSQMPEALFNSAKCFHVLSDQQGNPEWRKRAVSLYGRLKAQYGGSPYARMNYKK